MEDDFALKKVAYICLSLFFNDSSEELLLATNALKLDLEDKNHYVVALALGSFSEIADKDLCESLAQYIVPKIGYGQKYIRKKAIMASKSPEKVPQ